MEIVVNGKKVVLRESFPTREYDSMRHEFVQMSESVQMGENVPWQKRARLLSKFIKSWEFEGDPNDVEVWGDLDLFSETLAIESAITDFMTRRTTWMEESAKNSESGSTTQ